MKSWINIVTVPNNKMSAKSKFVWCHHLVCKNILSTASHWINKANQKVCQDSGQKKKASWKKLWCNPSRGIALGFRVHSFQEIGRPRVMFGTPLPLFCFFFFLFWRSTGNQTLNFQSKSFYNKELDQKCRWHVLCWCGDENALTVKSICSNPFTDIFRSSPSKTCCVCSIAINVTVWRCQGRFGHSIAVPRWCNKQRDSVVWDE